MKLASIAEVPPDFAVVYDCKSTKKNFKTHYFTKNKFLKRIILPKINF